MKKNSLILACLIITMVTVFNISPCYAVRVSAAPDATTAGPHTTASAEYRLPATVDADILSDRTTEIWAKAYYPSDINTISDKLPLVVLLHGNHGTCGFGSNPRIDDSCAYTKNGSCPSGYIVTPNHEGYAYFAENLASWGYFVVSINANRGITCGSGVDGDNGLNLARGRLVLKHLSLLYQWATAGGTPESLGLGANGLQGKLDFAAVGLFGHSRGGEGMRAAYNLYLDKDSPWQAKIPGLTVKAIFEIGAVDGQTSRILDANGTVWNQLLPMCDGDVSTLQGRYPFDRMLLNRSEPKDAQKSLYEVWGANHNYFNTEWQKSDASKCQHGQPIFNPKYSSSPEQQKIALASVNAFFRSRLGSPVDVKFNQNFNPLTSLPELVTEITQVDRDFTASSNALESMVFEDFENETGINSSKNTNTANQIKIEHKFVAREPSERQIQRVATIAWDKASPTTYFEAAWTMPGQGRDIHDFATLDFRINRVSHPLNTEPTTQFDINLIDADGNLSHAVNISEVANINGPGTNNPVLKTVRIPLTKFKGVDMTKIHSVRFTFNATNTGALSLANIRVHKQMGAGHDEQNTHLQAKMSSMHVNNIETTYIPASLNAIRIMRPSKKHLTSAGEPVVEIKLSSQIPFDVMDNLPILKIGDKEFKLSEYSDMTTLKEMTFTISEKDFRALAKNAEVTLINGKIWQFGRLK